MWYQKIIQVFRIPELRKKVLFILAIFVIFRIMANIPIPGVDIENLRRFFGESQFGQIFGLLNLFTGGVLSNFSIVMLGLGPYITSVIILQLLTMIFPKLERLYKEEGDAGRQKFNQYGRMLTVPFAMLQSFGMLTLLQRQNVISALDPVTLFTSILTITAGAVFLMWLGELISEQGIGNGISLLIFAGIVSKLPSNIGQFLTAATPEKIPTYLFFFAAAIVIIIGVVLVNEARRNIPVSYAKRVRGMKMYGGVSTYLPLNINPAGVIPIIFALSILILPGMIASFLSGSPGAVGSIAQSVGNFFQNGWVYGVFYFILVFVFTFFYTAVTFDPKAISKNLQKMGGFIPGVRPGLSTTNHLQYILNRVLFVGATSLGLIAIMPSVIAGTTDVKTFQFLVGGTALIIIVSVVLDVLRQINAQLQMREYETF